jgi:hypothetical protein
VGVSDEERKEYGGIELEEKKGSLPSHPPELSHLALEGRTRSARVG